MTTKVKEVLCATDPLKSQKFLPNRDERTFKIGAWLPGNLGAFSIRAMWGRKGLAVHFPTRCYRQGFQDYNEVRYHVRWQTFPQETLNFGASQFSMS